MGLISKLLKSNLPDADAAEPADTRSVTTTDAGAAPLAVPISTPVMMPAYVPPDARPTPTDVYDRATVLALGQSVGEDRPTMVMPEATAAVLAKATTAVAPPKPPVPRAGTKPASKPPPVPRPRTPTSGTMARPTPPQNRPPPLPTSRARKSAAAAEELDASFVAIEAGTSAGAGKLEVDLTDVRTLFGQLATNHMRQVRDFMIELRWGPTPATWVAVCEPSVESLRDAAEKLEFATLASGLRDFASAMHAVDITTTTTIDGDARAKILAAHDTLVGILPETFALDGDRSQREAAILHALLSQIPDVRKVTIDKLYAAGLTTLETMLLATVEDVVATTGIPDVLAERIVERFKRYREEMASMAVDETRAHERARIGELLDQLRRQNDEFEQAATAWTDDAIQRKKDALLARGQTMLEIDLQLARLGEVALVRELEKLPYARKVLKLDAFLAEADSAYAASGHR